jgi:tRNA dimethylallyltransferase
MAGATRSESADETLGETAGGAPLLALVGPTASGKSELGIALARAMGAEVLSLDSMLVYRGMDVGTARMPESERGGVPHHLENLVEPHERYDVQRYLADAARAEAEVGARGLRALFVGGTGLYLKALTNGLFDGPPVDLDLRARLEARAAAEGAVELHRELMRRDPDLGRRLHPNDVRRVVRGLEVLEQTGTPLSQLQQQWSAAARRSRLVGLLPDPAVLDARIAARTAHMFASGFVDEVAAIRARGGFGPTAAQALGYAEVLQHLDGHLAAADLPATVALHTRQFARRQRTWYRHFEGIRWIPYDLSLEQRVEIALAHLTAR